MNMDIESLKVGDEVGVGGSYTVYLAKVERKTATTVIVGGKRFNKRGYETGTGSRFMRDFLITAEDARERIAEAKIKRQRREMVDRLRNHPFGHLNDAQLAEVTALLASYKPQQEPQP